MASLPQRAIQHQLVGSRAGRGRTTAPRAKRAYGRFPAWPSRRSRASGLPVLRPQPGIRTRFPRDRRDMPRRPRSRCISKCRESRIPWYSPANSRRLCGIAILPSLSTSTSWAGAMIRLWTRRALAENKLVDSISFLDNAGPLIGGEEPEAGIYSLRENELAPRAARRGAVQGEIIVLFRPGYS